MEEKVSAYDIFVERIRGLAKGQKVPEGEVIKLEDFFKRMLDEKELDPVTELARLLGDEK